MGFFISSVKMPGANFETPVTINDLEFAFNDVFADEQRRRLQLVNGYYQSLGPAFGIVEELNPNTATSTSTRAFAVRSNGSNPLRIDVLGGVAVTKAGNIIILENTVSDIPVAENDSVILNWPYVVFAEYAVEGDTDTNTMTKYGTVEARRRVSVPDVEIVQVVSLEDFQNPVLFPTERVNDIVVLAIVKQVDLAQPFSIDFSNNVNTFNRPWFSPVDIAHRSFVGTGSADVAHRLGLNDMSQGAMTLYQQLLKHGQLLARDIDIPGCPGKLNTELITTARVFSDGSGEVTGTVGQLYARLLSYPIRLVGALSGDDPLNDIAVDIIPGSNILLLPTVEVVPTAGFTLFYTSSSAVEPPVSVITDDILQFAEPEIGRDLYVTGGKAFETLETTEFDIGKAGPLPKQYTVFIDASKQYVTSPQILVCARYVDASASNGVGLNNAQAPQFAMYGPAKVVVGLNDLLPAPAPINGFNIKVQLKGKDLNGVSITETLEFYKDTLRTPTQNYFPVATPTDCGFPPDSYVVDPRIYLTSTTVFSSLESWTITETTNTVPETVVMLWADLRSPTTPQLTDLMPIVNLRWNGQAVCRLRDVRPINSKLEQAETHDRFLSDLNTLVAQTNISTFLDTGTRIPKPLAAEDFNNPRWLGYNRSLRSRFSDGLKSWFVPELTPAFGAVFGTDADDGIEYYYTRAITIPSFTTQENIFLHLYGTENNIPAATNGTNLMQYRLATTATPAVWGSWLTPLTLNSDYTKRVPLAGGPYIKVQFRFLTFNVRGFISMVTGQP